MSSTSRASSSRQSIQPPVGPVNNVQAYGRPSGSGSAKRKSIVNPITTENEDLKYKAKYKELKKKVQEIELDNDKLLLDVLKTKKNIQRMRLERAILYERLAALGHDPLENLQREDDEAMQVEKQGDPNEGQDPSAAPSRRSDTEKAHHGESDRQEDSEDDGEKNTNEISMDEELLSLI